MSNSVTIPSNSNSYEYWFLPDISSSGIQKVAGNYMFVKPTNAGLIPVYIGKADDLSQRIPNHDRWLEAKALRATQVFAHMNINAFARSSEEQDLISYWNPPLNKQYRTGLALGGIGFDAG